MAITISGQNNNDKILASDGVLDSISGFNVVGVMTAAQFDVTGKTSTGHLSVGSNIHIGNAGIITATTLVGNVTGNINHTSNLLLQIGGSEKFRVGNGGQFGIAGANYGTAGQVFTSGGSGSAPTWSTITGTTINNNANNRLITGSGTANTLEGEANLTFSGSVLGINQASVDTNYVLDAVGGAIFTKTGTFTSSDFNKGHLTLRNTTASQGAFLDFRAASSGGAYGVIAKIGGFNTYSGSGYDGTLTFSTRQSSTNTMVERLRITSDGNIGINDSAPPNFTGYKSLSIHGSTGGALVFGDDGTDEWEIYGGDGVIKIYDRANTQERIRISDNGAIGLGGANYGSSGQVLTSGGSGSAVSWTTVSGTTINNNANNRIITGSGTANTLEGESTVTFDGTQFRVNAGNTSSIQVDGLYSYGSFAGVKIWRGAGNRSHNMGCGNNTLANASGGQDCTALGHAALQNSTSGSANTALGSHSMIGTVTGSNNVAVGHGALNKNTSGYNNTVVGRLAGLENLGGHNNTFLGMDAGTNNTSGTNNIYGGSGAGKYESTSQDNVAIGWNCFGGERSGGNSNQFNKNVCIGHQALAQQRISNGDGENVCIGYRAMYNTTTSSWRTVVIGFEAGYNNNGGSYNTFVGTYAGKNYTSGGNTMCLGYNAGTANSPSGNLTNQQDVICLGNNVTSQLYCNDTSISSSDSRDKTDITEWTHGLSFINQLKPITYRWDKRTWYGTDEEPIGTPDGSKKKAKLHLGFLAQDALAVEQSFGYASKKDDMLAVNLNEDETAYGMKYERLVVPLTKAVQELSAEIDKLKAEIAVLKGS